MRNHTLSFLTCLSLGAATALAQTAAPPMPPDNMPPMKEGNTGRHGKMGAMMKSLTPEERQKIADARAKAMQDPKVKAARERFSEAGREFRDAQRSALIAADPAMEGILKKMEESRPGGGGAESWAPGSSAQPTPSVPPPVSPSPVVPPQR
jgi:Spy/CpxP family protein refolding chaperone